MKKNILYLFALILSLGFTACEDPEYVTPTAQRQGITSITAIFTETAGEYVNQEAVTLIVDDPEQSEFVIPVPWYFPVTSDNETTTADLKKMRIKFSVDNNCSITPAVSILDLTQNNTFTFTDPYGKSRQITVRGERTRSNECLLKSFVAMPNGVSGIIDEEKKTITLPTAEDLGSCTFDVAISAHATIKSPVLAEGETINLNESKQIVVLAADGVTEAVYTTIKVLPEKIPYGFNSDSRKVLFENDLGFLGVTTYSSVHPTLAMCGKYVVMNYSDGSAPRYFDRITGAELGTINVGSASTAGAITSDAVGNMFLCSYAGAGGSVDIYVTNDVTKAPTLLTSVKNGTDFNLGGRIHVYGNIAEKAVITLTVDGWQCGNQYYRIPVEAGVAGTPELCAITGANSWNGLTSDAKVVARGTDKADGCFFGHYDSGANKFYYADGNNAVASSLSPASFENGWSSFSSACDCREFNGAKYLSIFIQDYFTVWSQPGYIAVYDVTSMSSFTGSIDNCSALVAGPVAVTNFTTVSTDDQAMGFGDVLLVSSQDGYTFYMYYVSNEHLGLGGIQFDCIKR